MSKHTPGPWKAAKDDFGGYIYADDETWMDNKRIICRIDTHAGESDEANACLIVLAPNLLELLKDAVDWLSPQYGYDPRLAEFLKRSREIIAKTEGVE